MRSCWSVVAAAAGVLLCARVAGAADYAYVAAGAEWEYATVDAERPTRLLGGAGLAALDGARAGSGSGSGSGSGGGSGGGGGELAWQSSLGPFGGDKPATKIEAGKTTRVAILHLRKSFRVGAEAKRLRVLRLRVKYRDALVVKLNGAEVARRNLDPAALPLATAQRVRGTEWETFYVDVGGGLLKEGDNLLEVEVRPHGTRSAPSVDVEIAGGEQARIVRGPIVQRLTSTSAVVVFETDAPMTGEVRWGAEASAYAHKAATPKGLRHEIEIGGLQSGQEVHYQVATADEASADHSFHAAPGEDEPLHFVVYGDVRSGHTAHGKILAAVIAAAPDFVLTTGDMVMRGSDEADWQKYFELCAPLLAHIPVYPAVGNHDTGAAGDGKRRVDGIFALPPAPSGRPEGAAWYSFDVAGVHFVMLDSNQYDDALQLEWLERDLADARARGVRAMFAVTHDGPYSRGLHGGNRLAAEQYVPVLAAGGVAVIFSGHDHLYQRGKMQGLVYVVSGGGGASLYKPRCGVPGKKKCKTDDGMLALASEHHFLEVEVRRDDLRLCPRRPDGTLLEKCVTVKLPVLN